MRYPGLRDLPPMSQREERMIRQRLREQIKPKSVAMVDQAKNFYMAVGQGISHWSRMEIRLVQVAAKLLRTTEEKAGLIMYSTNFHTWIAIIDELFVLDGTYKRSQAAWRKLVNPLKAENDIRVRLAHHSISQDEERVGEVVMRIQAYLRPAKLDVRTKSKKIRPLTMVEIVDFTERVNDLHDKLMSLLAMMKKRKSLR